MSLIFWVSQGVSMNDYLDQGRTINDAYYTGDVRRLRQEIARKRQEKLTRCVLLLQDNVPAHTSQVVITVATECGFKILLHPPYFPDIAPSDFCLFPKMTSYLRGSQYRSNEGVI